MFNHKCTFITESNIKDEVKERFRLLKNNLRSYQTDQGRFFHTINEINYLFDNQDGPYRGFDWSLKCVELVLENLIINFSIPVDDKCNRLSLVFKDCRIEELSKSSWNPITLFKSEIIKIRLNYSDANLSIEECVIGTIEPPSGYFGGGLTLNGIWAKRGSIDSISILKDSIFDNCIFEELTIGESDFTRCKISRIMFDRVIFKSAPKFIKAELTKTVHFEGCIFLDFSKASIGYYRQLRELMQVNQDESGVVQFSGLELKAKHEQIKLSNSLPDKIASYSYLIINNFGLNIYRPLYLLLVQCNVTFYIFLWMAKEDYLYLKPPKLGGPYQQALMLSFLGALGPFRLFAKFDSFIPTTIAGILFLFILMILSSLLWYFIITGIRKRFKVKE